MNELTKRISAGASAASTGRIKQIENQMAALEPGTIRYEALEAAKRFKGSWIDLGRILWTVWRERKFKEWGYLEFETYCSKEIGIRMATARKLLHSYSFLEKEEPDVLKRLAEDPPQRLPSAEAVHMLRLLSRKQGIPEEGYRHVRHYVLEKGGEGQQVRREIRSLLKEKDSEATRAARRQVSIRRMIAVLKAAKSELAVSRWVPDKLLAEMGAIIQKLEGAL